jgi:hypothetical protein
MTRVDVWNEICSSVLLCLKTTEVMDGSVHARRGGYGHLLTMPNKFVSRTKPLTLMMYLVLTVVVT